MDEGTEARRVGAAFPGGECQHRFVPVMLSTRSPSASLVSWAVLLGDKNSPCLSGGCEHEISGDLEATRPGTYIGSGPKNVSLDLFEPQFPPLGREGG